MPWAQETLLDRSIQKRDQRLVIALKIEDPARLSMQAQLRPSPSFEQFVHGADTAGKGQKRIRKLAHQPLSLRHRLDDVQLGKPVMADFFLDQQLRDDSGDAAASSQGGIGERAHEPDTSASIHHLNPSARERHPERPRQITVIRAYARARSTEDAECFHALILAPADYVNTAVL